MYSNVQNGKLENNFTLSAIVTSNCVVLTEPSRVMCMKCLILCQIPCGSEHVTVSAPLFSNQWNQEWYGDKLNVMRGTRLCLGRRFVDVCRA
jgi:hypothetical protein